MHFGVSKGEQLPGRLHLGHVMHCLYSKLLSQKTLIIIEISAALHKCRYKILSSTYIRTVLLSQYGIAMVNKRVEGPAWGFQRAGAGVWHRASKLSAMAWDGVGGGCMELIQVVGGCRDPSQW